MGLSAAAIKAGGRSRQLPTEGTELRKVFDELMKGDWMPVLAARVIYLRDFYDLEFEYKAVPRPVNLCPRGRKTKMVRCTGRWSGKDFQSVDDVRQSLEALAKYQKRG